jgi:tetratricopeptide (TPR) repeat protein
MALDPGYAPAFSYAAYWHMFRIGQEWSTDVAADLAEAERLAAAAITNDGNDATALTIFGHVQSNLRKDYERAIDFFDRAIATSQNSAMAWTFKGLTLCFIGDGPGAVQCAETGLRLSPLDNHVFFAEHVLAQAHYVNGNFDMAVGWARRASKRNAQLTSNLRTLISSLVAVDNIVEAREVAANHARVVPTFRVSAWAARTPMSGEILKQRIERLLAAGMPE